LARVEGDQRSPEAIGNGATSQSDCPTKMSSFLQEEPSQANALLIQKSANTSSYDGIRRFSQNFEKTAYGTLKIKTNGQFKVYP
jgi:hypothetical protein